MKLLGNLLNIGAMHKTALKETEMITKRFDVPNGPDVPADLRDTQGRMFQTAEGFNLTGRLLPDDMLQGSASPSEPLGVFALVGLVLLVMGFAQSGFNASETLKGLIVGMASLVLVVALIFGPLVIEPGKKLKTIGAWALGSLLVVVTFAPASLSQWVDAYLPMGSRGVAGVVMLAVAALPWWTARKVRRDRAEALALQGTMFAGEQTGALSHVHVEARQEQVEAAKKDKTRFIQIGTASGVFSGQKFDGFAPDESAPFGFTLKDMDTHLIVFGGTGSGKTSGVLRPIAQNTLEDLSMGFLVMDGSKDLPRDFVNVPGYILVEPGKCDVGLIEGLTPQEVIDAVAALNGQSGSGEGDKNAYFTSNAKILGIYSAEILEASVQAEKIVNAQKAAEGSPVPARQYLWTFAGLVQMIGDLQNDEFRKAHFELLRALHPDAQSGVLPDAMSFFETKWSELEPQVKGSIDSTLGSWMLPVMQNKVIRRWADLETGVDVTQVLRGGKIGICAPKAEFGEVGRLVSILLKQRVQSATKKRPDAWAKEEGATSYIFMVDECQRLLTKSDVETLEVSRSKGQIGVYATQTIDQVNDVFGETGAKAMLGQFLSFICLDSSEATLAWARRKLGYAVVRSKASKAATLDFEGTVSVALSSTVYDPTHPDADVLRRVRRNSGLGRIKAMLNKDMATATIKNGLDAQSALVGYTWKEDFLFSESDALRLKKKFTAVASVKRGGVDRRDIIDLNPIGADFKPYKSKA